MDSRSLSKSHYLYQKDFYDRKILFEMAFKNKSSGFEKNERMHYFDNFQIWVITTSKTSKAINLSLINLFSARF